MTYPQWFLDLLLWIEHLSQILPLELFVILGALLEELIPPIPSSAVLVAAGGIVSQQQGGWPQIIVLSVLAAMVKTAIAYVTYLFADKIEDILPASVLRVMGYKRGEAEKYGEKFSKGWKDAVILLLLRLLPVVPSLPVSLVCGFIKTDMKTYLWTSMIGFTIKCIPYFVVGYYGIEILQGWL